MIGADRSQGFTLVEVMVALTILTMVLLATVTGLRTLGNTQVSIERATTRVEEVRNVSEFMRDLMESAVVGGRGGLTLGGGVLEATHFRLGDGYIEWKTNILFGEAYGGVHVVRIADEDGRLVLRWLEPNEKGVDRRKWDDSPSRVLVENVQEFTMSARENFWSEWQSNWKESAIAPAVVRLQIKSSGRYWPELIMQVQR